MPAANAASVAIRALLVTGVVFAATAGCGGPAARLVWPDQSGTTSFFATIPDVPADQPVSLGSTEVCRKGGSDLSVVSVGADGARGLRLDAFSFRPDPSTHKQAQLGAEPRALSALGFPGTSPPFLITGECPSQVGGPGLWELAVQVSRTSLATGTAQSFTITFTSAGRRQTLRIPLAVTLCAPDDLATAECQR